MTSPSMVLTGIGLRAPHYTECLQQRPKVAWLEVHSENYFGDGGKHLQTLTALRAHYPISLHGVGLSLGSTDELNWQHLKKLRELVTRIDPCLVSEHLSWSSINGQYFHDLLPLPYTPANIEHLVARIQQVQDYLQRQILIENISSYVQFTDSMMQECDFLSSVAKQSGCGILLDVNNIYVSAKNLNFDPSHYIAAIPGELVQEIHLAGFTASNINAQEILIDTHAHPVAPAVWELYKKVLHYIGLKPTIIEWDAELPTLEIVCAEAYKAEKIMRETYATSKLTS